MLMQASLFVRGTASGAVISDDNVYRYKLWRFWDDRLPACAFIMLNPSVADASIDDPTIRRVVGYARSWDYGSVTVVNLFALRSTDPAALKSAADPVGPLNDRHIAEVARSSAIIVAAWGAHPGIEGRARDVRRMLADAGVTLHRLALTKGGHLGHPLFLKSDLKPVPMED
jgi:hypothetical protein